MIELDCTEWIVRCAFNAFCERILKNETINTLYMKGAKTSEKMAFYDLILLIIIKNRLEHEDIETILGTYGHLYLNSNFKVAHKLKGILSYQTSTENQDTSPKNQFTAHYLRKRLKTNNEITLQ